MRRLKGAARRRDGRAFLLPVGLFLLFCVLAMHGFQASPNQMEMSGVPLTSMSAGQHGADRAPASDDSGDHHPGGQVCLAMLTMLVFLVAAVLLASRSRERGVSALRMAALVRSLRGGRPPPAPSLHLLSVLRL
ncbi:DUF6153 family protein [Actinomadura decatromicini]|uniref:Uncharacterized protein n=1 Tax=Actinomadura decatromicini TaxID=2604572 RepID=A0A5D3FTD8_9ACTN|nr:DUF6153 family protein [Actinomadura decatromicini]TYK51216.1 hypothetical protein FXF68_12400 [Actinomadura decatromicini]